MAFEPGPKHRTVTDNDTGAVIAVRGMGSSISGENVEFSAPGRPGLKFELFLRPVSGEPNVIINVPFLELALRAQGRTKAENTALVEYILQGLVAIDRKWPLMMKTWIGSNYEEHVQKGMKFSFSMPSDEELKRLTA